jgi:hypothetical protein
VDRHKGYYDKSNKPGIKEQMLHDLICVWNLKKLNSE